MGTVSPSSPKVSRGLLLFASTRLFRRQYRHREWNLYNPGGSNLEGDPVGFMRRAFHLAYPELFDKKPSISESGVEPHIDDSIHHIKQ